MEKPRLPGVAKESLGPGVRTSGICNGTFVRLRLGK